MTAANAAQPARDLAQLKDAWDKINEELADAERSGDRRRKSALLKDRAQLWSEAAHLAELDDKARGGSGASLLSHACDLAAQSDEELAAAASAAARALSGLPEVDCLR